MKTSYTDYREIFDIFIGGITDQPFLSLPSEDIEEFCLMYLKRVIPKFTKCSTDLTKRSDSLMTFYSKLSELEVLILGTMMITEWLSPQVYNITVTKQFLADSDYKHFSQANHLDKLMQLRDKADDETQQLIILYTNHHMVSLND